MEKRFVAYALVVVGISALLALALSFQVPACESDDGSGAIVCLWDASKQGNQRGNSFLMIAGMPIYLN